MSKNDRPSSVLSGAPTNTGSRVFKTARESGSTAQNGDFLGARCRRAALTKFTIERISYCAAGRQNRRTRFKINEIKVYPKMASASNKSLSADKLAAPDGPFAAASMVTINEAAVGQRLDNFLIRQHVYRRPYTTKRLTSFLCPPFLTN